MQAILISLILIIYTYIRLLSIQTFGNLVILENLETMIFIATLSTVIFTSIQCLRGIEPHLPGISESAKMQI